MSELPIQTIAPDSASDFLDTSGISITTASDNEAFHIFRVAKDFVMISDTEMPGTQVLNIPLDPTMDPACDTLSQYYEYWNFEDLQFDIQATSPFGTASGSFQMAWITDPDNALLDQTDQAAKANCLVKVIRQEGSVQVRPRDTVKFMAAVPKQRLYCLTGTDTRLSSMGAVVGVLREPPALGDQARFTVTCHGKMKFYRSTFSLGATFASTRLANQAMLEAVRIENRLLKASFKCKDPPVKNAVFMPDKDFRIVGMTRKGRRNMPLEMQVGTFPIAFNTVENDYSHYDATLGSVPDDYEDATLLGSHDIDNINGTIAFKQHTKNRSINMMINEFNIQMRNLANK